MPVLLIDYNKGDHIVFLNDSSLPRNKKARMSPAEYEYSFIISMILRIIVLNLMH